MATWALATCLRVTRVHVDDAPRLAAQACHNAHETTAQCRMHAGLVHGRQVSSGPYAAIQQTPRPPRPGGCGWLDLAAMGNGASPSHAVSTHPHVGRLQIDQVDTNKHSGELWWFASQFPGCTASGVSVAGRVKGFLSIVVVVKRVL